nr:class I SAM-dependent methyltransferase [Halomonas lutea]
MIDAVLSRQPRRVLDLGCGEGWLCRSLADQGIECIGIDASRELVEAAREQGGGRFVELDYASLSRLMEETGETRFDIVVANFSLLDDALEATLDRIIPALASHGQLLIQTLHPWALQEGQAYRSGWRDEDFRSHSVDFSTSMPWFYRTMSDWVSCLARAGFSLTEVIEPACPESGRPLSLLMACRVAQ